MATHGRPTSVATARDFADTELRRAYRARLAPLRVARLRALVYVALVGNVLLAGSDALLMGGTDTFWSTLGVRLVVGACSLQALFALRRIARSPDDEAQPSLDHVEIVWGLLVLSGVLVINGTRETASHLGVDAMIVLCLCVSLRGVRWRVGLALSFCLADLSTALARNLPGHEIASLVAALVLSCVVGSLAASAIDRMLRARFLDGLADAGTGAGTGARDVLTMCAYCERVRSPAASDTWLRPAEYLAATTRRRISHGICTGCIADGAPYARPPHAERAQDDPHVSAST